MSLVIAWHNDILIRHPTIVTREQSESLSHYFTVPTRNFHAVEEWRMKAQICFHSDSVPPKWATWFSNTVDPLRHTLDPSLERYKPAVVAVGRKCNGSVAFTMPVLEQYSPGSWRQKPKELSNACMLHSAQSIGCSSE